MTKQFDSQSIDAYQARFTGKFDLEYSEGDGMDYGDQVMFVVYGNVSKSGISTDRKTGDMIRTNTVAITDAVPFEKGDLETTLIQRFVNSIGLDLEEFDIDDSDCEDDAEVSDPVLNALAFELANEETDEDGIIVNF